MTKLKIKKISIASEGYIHCHSCFYSSQDGLSNDLKFTFSTGINRLYGEIDSGVWAVSYLLSMYSHSPQDFILFKQPVAVVNGCDWSLANISKYSCYMDTLYPLFAQKRSVKNLVIDSLKREKSKYTSDNIRELFRMDSERFERPISGLGNEIFRAMAAIGYCNNKEIYCFPWLSKQRFENYHGHLTDVLNILDELEKIIVLPIGYNI